MVPDVPAGWVSLTRAVQELRIISYIQAWNLAQRQVPSVKIDGRLYVDPKALARAAATLVRG